MQKRVVFLVVSVLALILFVPGQVRALSEEEPAEPQTPDRYQYVESVSTSLSISGGTANAEVRVRDSNGDTSKISCTMYLQKQSNGSWSNLKSWSKSTNSNTLTMSHTKAVGKGKYRVKSVTKAYKGAKHETVTDYSKIKSY